MTSTIKVDQIQNAAGTAGLTIDSDGNVLKPNTVAFYATLLSAFTGNGSVAGAEKVTFNDVRVNTGSAYDSTTGIFTAPVTGSYFISHQITPSSSGDSARYFRAPVRLNNATTICSPHIHISDELNNNDYASCGAAFVYPLDEGDEVHIEFGSSIATDNFTFYADMNYFSAHLIG